MALVETFLGGGISNIAGEVFVRSGSKGHSKFACKFVQVVIGTGTALTYAV